MKKKWSFLKLRILPLIAAFFCFHAIASAQSVKVSGRVTDSLGNGVGNVSVKIKGTNTGTTTTNDGSFVITAPGNESVLVFTSVGFIPHEVSIRDGVSNIVLRSENQTLTDVVVIGYTTQTRSKTTASVAKLGADELKNRPSPNPVQAMQGKMAGVSVPVTSGQPGAGATNIIIRGGTKLNVYGSGLGNSGGNPVGGSDNTGPLVVIDGVFRSMDDINPDNIESFQVMKDAASTAIYGARGANGVIVIKTKGGKFNQKMNITFNNRSTWETQMRDYEYLDAAQYLALARTTVQNTKDPLDKNNLLYNAGFSAGTRNFTAPGQYGNFVYTTALYDNLVAVEGQAYVDRLLANGWQTMDDPINPGSKLIFADNHYQEKLWKTGFSQNNSLSIDGGSETANYNISSAYTDQKGIFAGTRYKRFDILGNFGFKVAKNARIDAMVNYQNVQPNYVEAFQNDLTRGTRLTPLIRLTRDDGRPHLGELYSARNRFHTLYYDDLRVKTERFVTRLGGDVTIIKGLHFRPSFSYFMNDYSYLFKRDATPANEIQPGTQRQKNHNTDNSRQFMIDQILSYDFHIGEKNNFSTLAGFNYTINRRTTTTMGSQRATNDYVYTINEPPTTVLNGQTVSNVTNFGTSIGETRSASFFGQANYDFDGKYLASASLRYDGFSNFAPENKWALFPSVSAGWNIHREEWFNVKPISMLKLRGSWGQAGLSDLSITDTYGGYGAVDYARGAGILRTNLSNPGLIWETTTTTDLAIDAGFFKNRLTVTFGWYNKLTQDRLASKPLPSESPFPSITYNNGVLQNKGIELELGATIIQAKDFTWRSTFVFAKNNQKVLELPENGRLKRRQGGDVVYDPKAKANVEVGGIAEGERPYALYVYQVLGVFATEAEAQAWNAKTKDLLASPQGITNGKHAGDFIFNDVNGDGVIDTKDQVFIGYRTPNITGGWQNTFTYKGISLRFNMDYALGHMISNGALARSLGTGRAFNEGAPTQALGGDIWQKEGDEGKQYARFSFADFDFGQRNYIRLGTLGNNNSYASDVSAMTEKGDFLAFREITLAYDIPARIMKKIKSTGMNVFASIFNIGYLTKYTGINPETYTGFDAVGYPRPRQYTLGATIRF